MNNPEDREEIRAYRISNDIVAHALAEVGKNVTPGITLLQLGKNSRDRL
jgi:methionine aminopeptidase